MPEISQDLTPLWKKAQNLVKQGFHVLVVAPNSKVALTPNFPKESLKTIDECRKKLLHLGNQNNLGISCSSFKETKQLLTIDVDFRKGGRESILQLELNGVELPETYTQFTPNGLHFVYETDYPLKQGVDVLGPGIDTRARGGYIVASGSVIDGKKYTDNGKAVIPLPKHLYKYFEEPKEKSKLRVIPNLNEDTAYERAKDYLLRVAPIAKQGEGGDHTTYTVACRVRDFGVDAFGCINLLSEHWNSRCEPPWQFEELSLKIENAYSYAISPQGSKSPAADLAIIEESSIADANEVKEKNYLEKINDKYAIIFMAGDAVIMNESFDEDGYPEKRYITERNFRLKYAPKKVQTGKGKPKTQADIWLEWEGRREYDGICFIPEGKPKQNHYNLWCGFSVEPLAKKDATKEQLRGFDLFMDHAKNNVCDGNDALFQWLMGYMAHIVQKPNERVQTSPVFRGGKGVGKNALWERFNKIIDRHSIVTGEQRYFNSNFNSHLSHCLVLVLDEAYWSGDAKSHGKLKYMITSPTIMIEAKGREPFKIKNLTRVVIIGNDEFLVPASLDERRYTVFDVKNYRSQDTKYFTDMRILMDEKGGNRLLLDYLLKFDLTKVDVNKPFMTKGLADQKILNLDNHQRWIYECLCEDKILGLAVETAWPTEIEKNLFYSAYENYMIKKETRYKRALSKKGLYAVLKDLLPSLTGDKRKWENDKTVGVYTFPALQEARLEFEKIIKHKISWEEHND